MNFRWSCVIAFTILFSVCTYAATEKGLSRRSFLIGSSAMVGSLLVPTSTAKQILGQAEDTPPHPRWLIGRVSTGKSDMLEALNKSGFSFNDLSFRFHDRLGPDFLNKMEQTFNSELRTSRVLGAIAQGQSVSLADGQLAFAEESFLKRGLGWQSVRVLNAAGSFVNGLVRILNSENFNIFVDHFSHGQIENERQALSLVEQLEGPSEGCPPLLIPKEVTRIIVEDKEDL